MRANMTALCPPENLYNLIPLEEVKVYKPPRYTSTFRENVKQEIKKSKLSNKTMGPAKVEVPSPKEYLQKHSKEHKPPKEKSARCLNENLKKPPVPKKTDQPIMGVQTKKNFISTNATDAVMGVPKKPEQIYVDSQKGDKHCLETSGLLPKYIKKKDFGCTPEYLARRNEEVRRAQDEYDGYVKERLRQGAMKQISPEERETILGGLKKNWDELNREYQGLSVVIDTTPKMMHKERLEVHMRQLERDIELIEKYLVIYIANQ